MKFTIRKLHFFTLFFLLSFLFSCQNNRYFDLKKLEKNRYNELGLEVIDISDFDRLNTIFDELTSMNNEEIKDKLSKQNPELIFVSFAFYYMANNFARDGDFNEARRYHELAAENYLNPQSYLKLAEYYFYKEIDYQRSYKYLTTALELKIEYSSNNRSHPIAGYGKEKAQYLLNQLKNKSDAGLFDRQKLNDKLKETLPELMEICKKMYHL